MRQCTWRTLIAIATLLGVGSLAYSQDIDSDPWAPLNLIDVPNDQCRLRVAPEFRDHLDEIALWVTRILQTQRERQSQASAISGNAPEIIARVNELLGFDPDESQSQKQRDLLDSVARIGVLAIAPPDKFTFVVTQKHIVKEHLRMGGTLPNHSYDPATDMASYYFGVSAETNSLNKAEITAGPELREFCLPVDNFSMIPIDTHDAFPGIDFGWTAIHEVAELSIFLMIDFADYNGRWFGDGFANVITMAILRERGLNDAIEDCASSLDVVQYSDIPRTDLILRFWPNIRYEIRAGNNGELMTEYESRLNLARYAWSHHECQRIVDDHGIEIIPRIMQAAAEQEKFKSQYLIGLVSTVTGDDISARLNEYQDFSTAQEGMDLYNRMAFAAKDAGDFDSAFVAASRSMEITLRFQFPHIEMGFAAVMLGEMGQIEVALTYLDKLISQADEARHEIIHALQEDKLIIAINSGTPELGYESIDQMLEFAPDCSMARAVRAHQLLHVNGKVGEARMLAEQLLAEVELPKRRRAMLEAIINYADDVD